MNDDLLDSQLRSALQARPEHVPRLDFAALAIAHGETASAQLARLARLARWTRLAGAAAALLVVGTLIAGYLLWPVSTTAAADTTTTSSLPDMTTLGIVTFLLAVVALSLMMLLVPERQPGRLALS